jgi:hypothetical protein
VGLAIGRPLRFDGHALAASFDQEEAGLSTGSSCGDEHGVGDLCGRHEDLLAGEAEAVAIGPGLALGACAVVASGFVQRGRENDLAPGYGRQPALLLGVAAEALDGQRPEGQRRQQRYRGHTPPDFLEQDAQREEAHAVAAVGLTDGDPEQVGLGELAPQIVVEDGLFGLQLLDSVVAGEVREDLARQLLDRALFLGE